MIRKYVKRTFLLICILLLSVQPVFAQSKVMVSMGDSYSSGEGIEPYYDEEQLLYKTYTDDWLSHRSTKSWSGQLIVEENKMVDYKDENWFFVATSGAETKNFYEEQKKDNGLGNLLYRTSIKNFR